MDGFESSDEVIIIGATNMAQVLDPAIMRPGRFDRKFKIPLPDKKQRRDIIEYHFKKARKTTKLHFNSEVLAVQTIGFSPADLANLVNNALLEAFKQETKLVDDKMFRVAFEKLVTGVKRKTLASNDRDKYLVALRHAAMAMIAHKNKDLVDFSFISLLPRDNIDGQMRTASVSERVFENEAQILAAIDVSLAAREMEKIIYGEDHVSTGSQEYLAQAGELAYLYAQLYGKGESLRLSDVGHSSESLRKDLDFQVIGLIQERREEVEKELVMREKKVKYLANKLLEREALTKEEVEKYINKWFNV